MDRLPRQRSNTFRHCRPRIPVLWCLWSKEQQPLVDEVGDGSGTETGAEVDGTGAGGAGTGGTVVIGATGVLYIQAL